MKAIILAAGRGSRMGTLTTKHPKCMTLLHGDALIEWQLQALKRSGIKDIALVRGYLAETFALDLFYFDNPRWDQTNMVMSLVVAQPWLEKSACIISYSDIIYSWRIVAKLMQAPGDIVISCDLNWHELWAERFSDPLSDAETFKIDKNGILLEIGSRPTTVAEIQGQYMGLLKITPKGWQTINTFLASKTPEQRDKMDMTALLSGLILAKVPINTVPMVEPWYEVDSESDLHHAMQRRTAQKLLAMKEENAQAGGHH